MRSRSMIRAASLTAVAVLAVLGQRAAQATPMTYTVKAGGGGDFTTIQAAIDAASAGDTIDVYPGSYSETAADRTLSSAGGTYTFGLFFDADHGDITVRGVDASGVAIENWKNVEAYVTTNATNNFGPSGIFVEGDGVTISGLDIGTNSAGQNKTIEVIGDGFTLADCDVTDVGGSLYFNDWRFDEGGNTSHVRSYRVDGNNFREDVSIDISSGAGFSGPVSGRVIRRNCFAMSGYWPAISFNGSDTGVPWFVYSVGGAVIRSNKFTNTFTWADGDPAVDLLTQGHIRARGTYDNEQFDWATFWSKNHFDAAYVTGPNPPDTVRAYQYTKGYTFENVRRIGALAEGEDAIAEPGDETLYKHN